jgi:hypothetical protein
MPVKCRDLAIENESTDVGIDVGIDETLGFSEPELRNNFFSPYLFCTHFSMEGQKQAFYGTFYTCPARAMTLIVCNKPGTN